MMKLIQSNIQLKKFSVMNYEYKFIPNTENRKLKIKEDLFDNYDIEIDFAWKRNDHEVMSFIKLSINRHDAKKIGYSIFIEGVGVFKLAGNLSEADEKNLIQYSCPSIVLQELRAIVRYNTSLSPYGAFNIPTINITEQVKLKMQMLQKTKLLNKPVKKK